MTLFDYILLGVVAVSIVVGIVRGAVREIFSLASWIGAFLVAQTYSGSLSVHLAKWIETPTLRLLATFVALFACSLALFMLVAWALSQLVRNLGLGPLDRALGLVFGAGRALFIAVMLVLLAGLTAIPKETFWRNAMFSAPLEAMAKRVLPLMPDVFRRRVEF